MAEAQVQPCPCSASSKALGLCLAGGQGVVPFRGPHTAPAPSKECGHLGGHRTAGTTMWYPSHTWALPSPRTEAAVTTP